jgi:AraC family transcriptional regulator
MQTMNLEEAVARQFGLERAPTSFARQQAAAPVAFTRQDYGRFVMTDSPGGAGLAPWQLRRAQAFIEAHLDGDPSVCDMARECRLSVSHFGRAFRQAMGMPPHQWLTKRRIERAKDLLRQGNVELAHIALACGFVDQSHLSRTFTRYEGYAPGKWRRLCCG